jgi:hypothetical protein
VTLESLFEALQGSPIGTVIAESSFLFPTIETAHVIALTLVVGSIGMMDLRLIGLAGKKHAVTRLASDVLPWTWVAFVAALITGSLLFTSAATTYWTNPFFRIKLVLLALAGLNMAIFHLITWKTVHEWDEDAPTPRGAKIAGLLSLTFWVGVVVCGRWIGFYSTH